jgi:hypothetical protein
MEGQGGGKAQEVADPKKQQHLHAILLVQFYKRNFTSKSAISQAQAQFHRCKRNFTSTISQAQAQFHKRKHNFTSASAISQAQVQFHQRKRNFTGASAISQVQAQFHMRKRNFTSFAHSTTEQMPAVDKLPLLAYLNFLKMKTFLQTHPPIKKAIRFFHTLFAQHVTTLNWVLFRRSLQLF